MRNFAVIKFMVCSRRGIGFVIIWSLFQRRFFGLCIARGDFEVRIHLFRREIAVFRGTIYAPVGAARITHVLADDQETAVPGKRENSSGGFIAAAGWKPKIGETRSPEGMALRAPETVQAGATEFALVLPPAQDD